jgi:hypothetical protein
MPKGRLEYLKRLLPYLKNQSEDCLYLNIYAPIQGEWIVISCQVMKLSLTRKRTPLVFVLIKMS